MDKDPAGMPDALEKPAEPGQSQENAFEGDSEAADRELYAGDTGTLPALTRQVLVHLLKGPYFERSRSERLWQELKVREKLIRSRLSDLYLDLLVDDELGVAFCRKPDLGDHDAPSLLNTVRLRFLDSAVLLELRDQLMRARANGERAVVTSADVAEMLRLFDRSAGTNDRIFQQHFKAILRRLTERRILLTLKSGDAMEISPVLPLLFPTAAIDELKNAYLRRILEDAKTPEEAEEIMKRYEVLKNGIGAGAAVPQGVALDESPFGGESGEEEESDADEDDANDGNEETN